MDTALQNIGAEKHIYGERKETRGDEMWTTERGRKGDSRENTKGEYKIRMKGGQRIVHLHIMPPSPSLFSEHFRQSQAKNRDFMAPEGEWKKMILYGVNEWEPTGISVQECRVKGRADQVVGTMDNVDDML